MVRRFLAFVFFAALPQLAHAIDFSRYGVPAGAPAVIQDERRGPTCLEHFQSCNLRVTIQGEISDATVDQLNQLLAATRRRATLANFSFTLMQVDLDSPGGSVNAAMAIGRTLRKEETLAVVGDGARCLSSCVLILAGAVLRGIEGQVGIHRPYFPVPRGEVSSEQIRQIFNKMLGDLHLYLREMNISEELADAMLRVSPENMHLLSEAELARYNLSEADPIWKETFELRLAKRFGLDRQEYMRRKLIAESRCGGPSSLGTTCYRSVLEMGY